MRTMRLLPLVIMVLGISLAGRANAANYYVDQSCSANGNGTADQCASTPGGAGAYKDPQSCFTNALAGDTCYIKNGTYITNNMGSTARWDGGFTVGHSGTSGAPITIRNYPGHSPLLANCTPGQQTYCNHPTITTPGRSYIVFDGLRVEGQFSLFGSAFQVVAYGNVIRNCEVTTGWEYVDGGNWSGIYLEDQSGFLVQNNYIHDIFVQSGGGQQASGTCIKMYQNNDAVVEYNTCRHVPISESQAGGIDDKAGAVRNVHRRNWIEDVPNGIRINNQLNSTGVRIYENVIIAHSIGIKLLTAIDGIDIYNNTVADSTDALYIAEAMQNVHFYNNLIARATDNNTTWYNGPTSSNYNVFSLTAAAPAYRGPSGWYNSLASYQSATGLDANSMENSCGLATSGTEFHLSTTSSCRNFGRVGGVASGQPIDVGAYANTSCVGYGCSNPQRPTLAVQ